MFKTKNKNLGRRNSTHGKVRTPVFSYYTSQGLDSMPDQPRNTKADKPISRKAPNSRQHLRNLPTYLAISLILMSVIYALTLDTQPKLLIGQVDQNNSLVRSQATYQQAIHNILLKSVFNRSKLTINTDSVAQSIENAFPHF